MKRAHFETDVEAAAYVEQFLPNLPMEIWLQILTQSPSLTIRDIDRICRVNRALYDLCQNGTVWKDIFKRQFPGVRYESLFEESMTWDIGNANRHLLVLLVWRIFRNHMWMGWWLENDQNQNEYVAYNNQGLQVIRLPEALRVQLVRVAEQTAHFAVRERHLLAFLLSRGFGLRDAFNRAGCQVCGNAATFACGSCLSVAYCGKACQQAHWPEHACKIK